MRVGFHGGYLLAAFGVLVVEMVIVFRVHDHFIRPFVADYLVTILIYLSVKTLVRGHELWLILGSLLFCYAVEFAQKIQLLQMLGLEHEFLLRFVFGSSFDRLDLLAYTLSALTLFVVHAAWCAHPGD